MQKKGLNRESFVQKFPDSERGEMKARASFLGGDFDDEIEDSSIRSFKNLQQLAQSPTVGDKTPFSKTPRAKMGADAGDEEGAGASKDKTSPKSTKQQEKDKGDKEKEKKNLLGKFLSKHRNKK